MIILLDKMRITARSEKRVKLSKNYLSFYSKYAFVVFGALRKPLFQRFLYWLLTRENIEKRKVRDVQIRMFPLRKENGNGLAGKCKREEGKIFIYPRTFGFCLKKMQELGKETLDFYVKSRARAALIHELLHLKYASDEEKVRELTRRYFRVFSKHQRVQSLDTRSISRLLFT
jgi:hypothetical protein